MRRRSTAAFVAAVVLILSACAHNGAVRTGAPGATGVFADPSVPIGISPGERFVIVLDSNPTTGYSWREVPRARSIITLKSSEYRAPQDSRIVGKGGVERWEFTALSPGTEELSFEYVRPWEKDVAPARKVSFTVVVRDRR